MADAEVGGLSKARIETLADGIFAIAMTLLLFNLKVPVDVHGPALRAALWALGPGAATYAVSFVILGCYWIGHHNQYYFIRRTDRAFLWINLLFLMGVAAWWPRSRRSRWTPAGSMPPVSPSRPVC